MSQLNEAIGDSQSRIIFTQALENQQHYQNDREALQNGQKEVQIVSVDDIQRARIQIINIGLDPEWLGWATNACFTPPRFKYFKQGFYFGELVNKQRHGNGIMIYDSEIRRSLYAGEWQNDKKHGDGTEIFINGDKYTGQFGNGKFDGDGTLLLQNGDSYKGSWSNGIKHGYGIWTNTQGKQYEGDWSYGEACGHGKLTLRDGAQYEGEFKNFLKHGLGREEFSNGDFYHGEYINGKPDGRGKYKWRNGNNYTGEFCGGLRHGKGFWQKSAIGVVDGTTGQNLDFNAKIKLALQRVVSDCYDGDYMNDKKCGKGVFRWASGAVYEGQYFDDYRHGYGEMRWPDGSHYKGQWNRGVQRGKGEMYRVGQTMRQGLFENNKMVFDFNSQSNGEEHNNSKSWIQRNAVSAISRRVISQNTSRYPMSVDRSMVNQDSQDLLSDDSSRIVKFISFAFNNNKQKNMIPFLAQKPVFNTFINIQQQTSSSFNNNDKQSEMSYSQTKTEKKPSYKKITLQSNSFTRRNYKPSSQSTPKQEQPLRNITVRNFTTSDP